MIRNAILSFILGAIAYVTIELIFRGRTHISMAIAGGLCMLILHFIFMLNPLTLLAKCLLSMIVITAVEFSIGVVVNIWLKLDVWSYSHMPMNVLGQICPLFSGLWFLMGVPIAMVSDFIKAI